MSSKSSENSLFSIEPIAFSDNSLFSIEEYSHIKKNKCQIKNIEDEEQNLTTIFSIEPLNLGESRYIQVDKIDVESSLLNPNDEVVSMPLKFRRIPRQVSVKRYNFLCSDRQISIDLCKLCCGSLCLSKFGKTNLRGLREKYLSLNGDEQDTFLVSHMQLVKDHLAVSCAQ